MKPILKVLSPVAGALGLFKTKKPPLPIPVATRDAVRERQFAEDQMLRRRGGAADVLTGEAGAEPAPAGLKSLLGM